MNNFLRVLAWPAFKNRGPYNVLLYRSMQTLGATVEEFSAWRILSKRYDVVHLHWPEYCVNGRGAIASLFWSCSLFTVMCWVRLRGSKVVWTVHNLQSHLQQHPGIERYFWKIFTALLSGYIALTETGAKRARHRYPALRSKRGFIIPHGNIRDAYSGVEISREEARLRLGISPSARVVGFFGSVERYKGITELVEAFSTLDDNRAVLYAAGKCYLTPQERAHIEHIAAHDSRVHLRLEYIPDADAASYIRASDLVVLPFREILNSGSAVLALSLDRPVLVPARGAMPDLQQFAGAEWVRLYSGELTSGTLQQRLDAAIEGAAMRGRCRALESGWAGLGWNDLAQLTLDAYQSVIGAAPQYRTNASRSGKLAA
ncbi:MAG TPA: glycosyltransferase [Candidatus Angelobacter sp.]|nr:glycosyltransferase [Candidatus Angelobacter sp.]